MVSYGGRPPISQDKLFPCAPQRTIRGHFVESGQAQALRSSIRPNLRVCCALPVPWAQVGEVLPGPGKTPVPAGIHTGGPEGVPEAVQACNM